MQVLIFNTPTKVFWYLLDRQVPTILLTDQFTIFLDYHDINQMAKPRLSNVTPNPTPTETIPQALHEKLDDLILPPLTPNPFAIIDIRDDHSSTRQDRREWTKGKWRVLTIEWIGHEKQG